MTRQRLQRWCAYAITISVLIGGGVWIAGRARQSSPAWASTTAAETPTSASRSTPLADNTVVRVEIVHPEQGGIPRQTTRPCTIIGYESARLFAKIPGFLQSQSVDIGDRVKRGQVLAEIDVPEVIKEVEQARAALAQSKAQVLQADAHIETAKADHDSALAAVKQAEADIDKTVSYRAFREKQFERFKALVASDSVEERLVDEKQDELEAARAAERLSRAGVTAAKAKATAAAAYIDQARADAVEARAKVEVTAAALSKSEVLAGYLKIVSPYDGVITRRDFFRGDFIQSADKDARTPLLAVDRTDLMRVVVQVADEDVPLTNPGDAATVSIDALPGVRFTGKVSRVAEAEDTSSRTMRTEIDLPNDKGLLRQGMYGQATIQLGVNPAAVRIPSSSVVGDVTGGKGKVYVCRQGIAHLVNVRLGQDNGVQVEAFEGVSPTDDVVRQPSTAMFDGARVAIVTPTAAGASRSANPNK